MKIITIPHPTLRTIAEPVVEFDINLRQFISKLESTLAATQNPKGVGLAAPQVDKKLRVFTTAVDQPLTFINPEIIGQSQTLTLGPDADDPILEGCLSMPNLYGPVPRHSWVEVEFQTLDVTSTSAQPIKQSRRFVDFFARVIQHELDHLNGVLFVDHSLQYDLPVYHEKGKDKTEEVERSFLELI